MRDASVDSSHVSLDERPTEAWIGELPSSWRKVRMKNHCHLFGGGTPNTEKPEYWGGDIPWVSPKDMKVSRISTAEDFITEKGLKESASNKVKPGSIVVVVRSGILQRTIPVGLVTRPVALNQDIKALVFDRHVVPEYILYLIIGCASQLLPIWRKLGCTVESLDTYQIGDTTIPLPSLPEQKTIAEYLDRKTGAIDRKVELLEKKAQLYRDLKQSLINETVTRGLDKSAPLRDSGVDWIGQVPEHWEMGSVTEYTHTISVKNNPDAELLSVYRDYGVIIKSSRDDNHNRAGKELSSYKLVKPGWLVINKMKAWQGSLGVSEYHGIVSPAYIVCRVDHRKIDGAYFHYLLRSRRYVGQYNALSYGVRNEQWDMRYNDFKYLPIPLPPRDEQIAIAAHIKKSLAKIDLIVETIETQITKFKELRKSLINDVVTGKIRVNQPTPA